MSTRFKVFLLGMIVAALAASFSYSAHAETMTKSPVAIDFNGMINDGQIQQDDLTTSLNDIYSEARQDSKAQALVDFYESETNFTDETGVADNRN